MTVFKNILKTFLAGIVAVAILCSIMLAYSFVPTRVVNEIGNTDYVYDYDSIWVRATEGLSLGKIDAQGFNNKNVIENPDIVILGSSHAEAMNVMQDDNMTELLNKKFDGTHSVYNMSISGHTFFKVAQYLPKTLASFENVPKFTVIETSTTLLLQNDVDMAIEGKVPQTKVNSGIIAELQKLPFLRQIYHQLDSGMLDMLLSNQKQQSGDKEMKNETVKTDIDEIPYEKMFSYLKELEKEFGTEIIIMFHPFETLDNNGDISFSEEDSAEIFAEYAERFGISFINMTSSFEKMYYEGHYVPHGFSTGALGEGHINKFGHAVIADEIFDFINDFEAEG